MKLRNRDTCGSIRSGGRRKRAGTRASATRVPEASCRWHAPTTSSTLQRSEEPVASVRKLFVRAEIRAHRVPSKIFESTKRAKPGARSWHFSGNRRSTNAFTRCSTTTFPSSGIHPLWIPLSIPRRRHDPRDLTSYSTGWKRKQGKRLRG